LICCATATTTTKAKPTQQGRAWGAVRPGVYLQLSNSQFVGTLLSCVLQPSRRGLLPSHAENWCAKCHHNLLVVLSTEICPNLHRRKVFCTDLHAQIQCELNPPPGRERGMHNIRPFIAKKLVDTESFLPRWRATINRLDIDNLLHFVANQDKAAEPEFDH
jgi:hypothetical protein